MLVMYKRSSEQIHGERRRERKKVGLRKNFLQQRSTMKKKSAIKERRANITNYFLELVKEGSTQEIKTFYSYFSYDVNLLFEENLSNDTLNNPIRVAYIRGDPKIFNQIIKLNPNLFAKTQANDVSTTE
jgi:hypothetical protein